MLKPTGTWRPYRTNHAVKDNRRSGVTNEKNIFAYVPLRCRSTSSLPRRALYPPSRASLAVSPGNSFRTVTVGGSNRSGTRTTAPAMSTATIPIPNNASDTAAPTSDPSGGRDSWAARLGRIQENGMARAAPAAAKSAETPATATTKPARLRMYTVETKKLNDIPSRNERSAAPKRTPMLVSRKRVTGTERARPTVAGTRSRTM